MLSALMPCIWLLTHNLLNSNIILHHAQCVCLRTKWPLKREVKEESIKIGLSREMYFLDPSGTLALSINH